MEKQINFPSNRGSLFVYTKKLIEKQQLDLIKNIIEFHLKINKQATSYCIKSTSLSQEVVNRLDFTVQEITALIRYFKSSM